MNRVEFQTFRYKFIQFDQPLTLATLSVSKLWEDCKKCSELTKSRRRVVFGSGNPFAKLMIIGEAPGANEDNDGVPFVGKSGDFVNSFLKAAGMTRSDVWVDNMIQCQPLKDAGNNRKTNRPPTTTEVDNCLCRIWETIRLIDPWLILALGSTALKGLTGDNQLSVTKVRGDVFIIRVPGVYKMIEYPMVALQHPSYVLRDETQVEYSRKWWFKEDFKFAVRTLHLAERCYGKKKQ